MGSSKSQDFDYVYDKYAKMLFRIAYLYTGNREESEDVLQEVFIKFLYSSPEFSSCDYEKAWLIRTTNNCCKDYLKSSRRRNVPLNDEIEWEKSCDDDKRIDLEQKIIALGSKYKAVIFLYYYEDYTIDEISGILKLSKSAVKMRLKRGREMLEKELEGYDYD